MAHHNLFQKKKISSEEYLKEIVKIHEVFLWRNLQVEGVWISIQSKKEGCLYGVIVGHPQFYQTDDCFTFHFGHSPRNELRIKDQCDSGILFVPLSRLLGTQGFC